MHDSNGFVMFGFKRLAQHVWRVGFAPRDVNFIGGFAIGDGHLVPTVGKSTIDQHEHVLGN